MKKCKVPTIETERLRLRMWTKKDAQDFFAYANSPNVGPNAGWRPHQTVSDSKLVITNYFWRNMVWAIEHKEDGKVIGSIALTDDKFRAYVNSKELGYSLSEDYWGKGIMTEAASRMIKYAFEELELDVLMITTGEENQRSQRVIDKCGFKYEGTLRKIFKNYDGNVKPVRCYSMLREEYYNNI